MADRFAESNILLQKHATKYKQLDKWLDQLAERINPVRQINNKLSAVCLKFLYVHY